MKSTLILFLIMSLSSVCFGQDDMQAPQVNKVDQTEEVTATEEPMEVRQSAEVGYMCLALEIPDLFLGEFVTTDNDIIPAMAFADANGNILEAYAVGDGLNVAIEIVDPADSFNNLVGTQSASQDDFFDDLFGFVDDLEAHSEVFFTVEGEEGSVYLDYRHKSNVTLMFYGPYVLDGALNQINTPVLYQALEDMGLDKARGDFDTEFKTLTDENGKQVEVVVFEFNTQFICEGIELVTAAPVAPTLFP